MIFKLNVPTVFFESARSWAAEVGEELYSNPDGETPYTLFGSVAKQEKLLKDSRQHFPGSKLSNHNEFLGEAIVNGVLVEWSNSITITQPAKFKDLPADLQKSLKEVDSVVSWMTAFLLAAGVKLYQLRKIQSRLKVFVGA